MVNKISFKSKFGWITVIEDKKKILLISFKRLKSNILLKGSTLQIKIWRELQKIPYGETKSYGDIAKKVNTSPRYVGNVCGQNSHLLIIPCHRVIRADRSLGGFSGLGGVKLKERLLNLEKNE